MSDFLLELRSEEIPARMQGKARDDLARLFAAELAKAGIATGELTTYATPRRLVLIARDLPDATAAVSEEVKGPRTSAPPQALDGFLRKTGLAREQLTERDGVYFAVTDKPGRATAAVLAEAIPAIVRAFPWPKSMRWGDASASTDSLRWVRPLQGIVALFGEELVPVEIAGIVSGYATLGHRFHHPGPITIGSADDYVEKLRLCHVIVDQDERAQIIALGATLAANKAGLTLVRDEGLLAENAGLTEWPVPFLGRFDPDFLSVPPEVIQLTARVNQKYFVCTDPNPPRNGEVASRSDDGAAGTVIPSPSDPRSARATSPSRGGMGENSLANAFICTANIDAADGGLRIVEGNRKVLAARLSDARFFYGQDLKVPLDEQAKKLDRIVFHEKLGTVADKVARVAKLARWLVEEGIVGSPSRSREGLGEGLSTSGTHGDMPFPNPSREREGSQDLAALAERAALLCKADLVTGMVAEFPELQGVMGGYYAAAQGEDPRVAAAIRDHYKPVGQGDDVPTAPVTVAVSLADKLDTLAQFFAVYEQPTGSRDPYALRRAALAVLNMLSALGLRIGLKRAIAGSVMARVVESYAQPFFTAALLAKKATADLALQDDITDFPNILLTKGEQEVRAQHDEIRQHVVWSVYGLLDFFADRLKVQQREAGVRHDLIDAVFALGGEDDLVRLLARVRALQAFVGTEDGANLLAGYKRAANILKKEGYEAAPLPLAGGAGGGPPASHEGRRPDLSDRPPPDPLPHAGGGAISLSYTPEPAEEALHAALDSAEPAAADAVAREDFAAAMQALASLRAPIDRFFEEVIVNDPDPAKRLARLALLARVRDAVHTVADFSKIEG